MTMEDLMASNKRQPDVQLALPKIPERRALTEMRFGNPAELREALVSWGIPESSLRESGDGRFNFVGRPDFF